MEERRVLGAGRRGAAGLADGRRARAVPRLLREPADEAARCGPGAEAFGGGVASAASVEAVAPRRERVPTPPRAQTYEREAPKEEPASRTYTDAELKAERERVAKEAREREEQRRAAMAEEEAQAGNVVEEVAEEDDIMGDGDDDEEEEDGDVEEMELDED